jgi:AmmeMemoRadiSam system protein A
MVPLGASDKWSLLRLARSTLEEYLSRGLRPESPIDSPGPLTHRAAFVTLRVRATDGLRGCRGEVEPRRPLVESVAIHAIAAAVDDPRFPPVGRDELDGLTIHISALTVPARIAREEIVLGRHGLLITHQRRSGLLLPLVPSLYGIKTVEEFLAALCRKASLPLAVLDDPRTRLIGFEAEDWGEEVED